MRLGCVTAGCLCCCDALCGGLPQARGDVATCLVTGNLEPVGWGKMQALGIEHLFTQPR